MSLAARLRARIATDGPIPFRDFMEAALYDPEGGFYARGQRLGPGGAFSTAPTRAPRFAEAVAAEMRACFEALGRPAGFTLVEAGPGDGTLAAALAGAVDRVVLIERAAGMRDVQRAALAQSPVPVEWATSPVEVQVEHGFVVANELFDALAVRLFEGRDEVHVGLDEGGAFTEALRPAADAPDERRRSAVAPEAPGLLVALASCIARGRLLVADYGDDGPATGRPIRTYMHGMRGASPLQAPGRQDLTADVDFGALRRAAAAAGLRELGYGDQAAWLHERAGGEAADLEAALVEQILEGLPFKVLLLEKISG